MGTVTAAAAPLLTPTIRQFRQTHPATQVEVIVAQEADIHRAALEGSFNLGLVNYLEGDDRPPEFETTPLLQGRVVVCMRPGSPLAGSDAVRVSDLAADRDAVRLPHAPLRPSPAARPGPGALLLPGGRSRTTTRRCSSSSAVPCGAGPAAGVCARFDDLFGSQHYTRALPSVLIGGLACTPMA
jgi:DNA-binding transcriptional LysR family regulator